MALEIKRARRYFALFIGAIWLASLALPAATFVRLGFVPGAAVAIMGLMFGWAAFQFGAFANLILIVLCIQLFLGRRASATFALLAEALAIWSFTWNSFPDDYYGNEIIHFSYGFYAWQLSILLLTLCTVFEGELIRVGIRAGYIIADK